MTCSFPFYWFWYFMSEFKSQFCLHKILGISVNSVFLGELFFSLLIIRREKFPTVKWEATSCIELKKKRPLVSSTTTCSTDELICAQLWGQLVAEAGMNQIVLISQCSAISSYLRQMMLFPLITHQITWVTINSLIHKYTKKVTKIICKTQEQVFVFSQS